MDIQNLVAGELKKLETPETPVKEKAKPVRKRALRASVRPSGKGKQPKTKEPDQTISM
jgi:hypothetical protein